MPDARALPAYLTGLASRNVELRKACRLALTAVRTEALPTLEQLVQRKLEQAIPVTLADVENRNLFTKLRDGVARLFSPYL